MTTKTRTRETCPTCSTKQELRTDGKFTLHKVSATRAKETGEVYCKGSNVLAEGFVPAEKPAKVTKAKAAPAAPVAKESNGSIIEQLASRLDEAAAPVVAKIAKPRTAKVATTTPGTKVATHEAAGFVWTPGTTGRYLHIEAKDGVALCGSKLASEARTSHGFCIRCATKAGIAKSDVASLKIG